MDERIHDYCRERFASLERRMNIKSEKLDECTTDIEVLKTDMGHLTRSLNALTKALWGVAASMLAVLLGFFIWYIQSL